MNLHRILTWFICLTSWIFYHQTEAKHIDGFYLILEESDPEYETLYKLMEFQKKFEQKNKETLSQGKRILLLSDGFHKKWGQMGETLQKILPETIEIYKTDLECPKDMDQTRNGNLFYKKVDNLKAFPFEDQFFDMILMRYGLCICTKSCQACGGVRVTSDEDMTHFLSEVARVINPNWLHSFAFLHGPSNGQQYLELKPYEEIRETVFLRILPMLAERYPDLNFKLLFFKEKEHLKFQGVYITPS